MSDRPKCLHCSRNVVCRPRGLCSDCYYQPEVREKYPRWDRTDHISEEELNALIESRYSTMPRK